MRYATLLLSLVFPFLVVFAVEAAARREHAVQTTALRGARAQLVRQSAAEKELAQRESTELRALQDRLDALEAELEVKRRFGPGSASVWSGRVARLRTRLAEKGPLPPEFACLEPKDWIDAAVRIDDPSAPGLDHVAARLLQLARHRVASKVHAALKAFVEKSGGELPSSIDQLRPWLPADLAPAALAGYVLKRSGRVEDRGETLVESQVDGRTVQLSLDRVQSSTRGSDWAVLDDFSFPGMDQFESQASSFGELMRSAMENLGPRIGAGISETDMDATMKDMKAALARFRAENAGRTPSSLAELRNYSPRFVPLAENLRSFFAEFEYAMEHRGALPKTPADMKRYLDGMTVDRVLRRMVITADADGEHGNLSFNLKY